MSRRFGSLVFTVVLVAFSSLCTAQELYVFSEPASNLPAKSISLKHTAKFLKGYHSGRLEQRQMPEIMFGLNKNWMIQASTTFSDMYSSGVRWESARLYAKYRFFSRDELHRHFRMAAFANTSYSRNDIVYDELSLQGDQSGVQGGVILTQLVNKLAVSSTLSYLYVTTPRPKSFPELYPYQAFDYSLSAGYLLLPFQYTDYRQTNLNLYVELLGQQSLDRDRYFVDLAPAIQFIFNSNAKLNIGYRMQLNSNMHRMAQNRFLIAFERTLLNAL